MKAKILDTRFHFPECASKSGNTEKDIRSAKEDVHDLSLEINPKNPKHALC